MTIKNVRRGSPRRQGKTLLSFRAPLRLFAKRFTTKTAPGRGWTPRRRGSRRRLGRPDRDRRAPASPTNTPWTRETPREPQPKPQPSRGSPVEMYLAIHSCPPPRTEARCGSRPGDRTVPFSRCAPPLRELGRMPPPAVTRLQHPWITPGDNQECTTRLTAASRQNAPEFSRTTPTFREEIHHENGGVAGQYPPQN